MHPTLTSCVAPDKCPHLVESLVNSAAGWGYHTYLLALLQGLRRRTLANHPRSCQVYTQEAGRVRPLVPSPATPVTESRLLMQKSRERVPSFLTYVLWQPSIILLGCVSSLPLFPFLRRVLGSLGELSLPLSRTRVDGHSSPS